MSVINKVPSQNPGQPPEIKTDSSGTQPKKVNPGNNTQDGGAEKSQNAKPNETASTFKAPGDNAKPPKPSVPLEQKADLLLKQPPGKPGDIGADEAKWNKFVDLALKSGKYQLADEKLPAQAIKDFKAYGVGKNDQGSYLLAKIIVNLIGSAAAGKGLTLIQLTQLAKALNINLTDLLAMFNQQGSGKDISQKLMQMLKQTSGEISVQQLVEGKADFQAQGELKIFNPKQFTPQVAASMEALFATIRKKNRDQDQMQPMLLAQEEPQNQKKWQQIIANSYELLGLRSKLKPEQNIINWITYGSIVMVMVLIVLFVVGKMV